VAVSGLSDPDTDDAVPIVPEMRISKNPVRRASGGVAGGQVEPKDGLTFVERHGVVLQAARGPVPSLAEAIAGGPIRGSWWGHSKGHEIFRVAEAIRESPDILICKLVEGKVTYIHRRLWPALVKLAPRFRKEQLARVWNEHTRSGAHRTRRLAFPAWVPREVLTEARRLSLAEAEVILSPWLALGPKRAKGDTS
jgi:hypothetical protein